MIKVHDQTQSYGPPSLTSMSQIWSDALMTNSKVRFDSLKQSKRCSELLFFCNLLKYWVALITKKLTKVFKKLRDEVQTC